MPSLPIPDPADSADPGSAAEPQPSRQVLRQFRIIFNAVKTHFRRIEYESGLGGAQVWALSVVAESPGIGVGRLAEVMDIRQPTASNLVRGLVGKGLLRSERCGPDRRTVSLFATDEAQSILTKVPGPWSGVLPHALDTLDEATLLRMHADLEALIRCLGEPGTTDAANIPLAQL